MRTAALRLGELLEQRGQITRDQLLRALRNQKVVGGRLGTCLLEIEAVTEEQLCSALAQQQGAPCASPEDLRGIPDDVLEMLAVQGRPALSRHRLSGQHDPGQGGAHRRARSGRPGRDLLRRRQADSLVCSSRAALDGGAREAPRRGVPTASGEAPRQNESIALSVGAGSFHGSRAGRGCQAQG